MDKEKVLAILKRAAWTFLQAFLAIFIANVHEGQAASEVAWAHVFEVALVAGLLSVAKSFVVGIPEGVTDGTLNIDTKNPNVWQFDFENDPYDFKDKNKLVLNVKQKELSEKEKED